MVYRRFLVDRQWMSIRSSFHFLMSYEETKELVSGSLDRYAFVCRARVIVYSDWYIMKYYTWYFVLAFDSFGDFEWLCCWSLCLCSCLTLVGCSVDNAMFIFGWYESLRVTACLSSSRAYGQARSLICPLRDWRKDRINKCAIPSLGRHERTRMCYDRDIITVM